MPGVYPDVPSWRIPYDLDGSILLINGVQTGQGNLTNLNDHAGSWAVTAGYPGDTWWNLLFAQPLDIVGMTQNFGIYGAYGGQYAWSYSTDTSNGTDGTWIGMSSPANSGDYRSYITPYSLTNVKGVRSGLNGATGYTTLFWLHIYGDTSASVPKERLQIWHPTLDERVPPNHFNWGDTPRETTADQVFRVKNRSETLTANNITLSISPATDTTPSVPGYHYLSDDGLTFGPTVTIPILYPGEVSPLYTLRRAVPSNAQLSRWAARLDATAESWT